jgi:hypothetical protein
VIVVLRHLDSKTTSFVQFIFNELVFILILCFIFICMMKKSVFVLLIVAAACTNAHNQSEPEVAFDRNQFFVVNYEELLNNPSQVLLSGLTDSIEYVKLETADSCLLHNLAKYIFTDKYIFVDNVKQILMFSRSGKFIRKIGKQGRGPGEIGLIRYLSVIDSEELLAVQINWNRKLFYFSYNGDFVKSENVPDVMNIKVLQDGKQIYYDYCANGFEDYMFALRNREGDTSSVVLNHFKWENKTGATMTVHYHLFFPFYEYGGITSMKSMYNDTVYVARGDEIMPEYFINLGNYELPEEHRPEVLRSSFENFRENATGKRFAVSFESAEKLFISSLPYSNLYEETGQLNMIYDRRSGIGNLVVDMEGNPGMITNDIDGGVDFWPIKSVNDSTLLMPILPIHLLGEEVLEKVQDKAAIDPLKKMQFLKMREGLAEDDNPVLMIIHLRKRSRVNSGRE